jgi:hypothetical protein
MLAFVIDAARKSINFKTMWHPALFDQCIKNYQKGLFDIVVLEDFLVKIIDAAQVNSPNLYLSPFYGLGRAVQVADGFCITEFDTPRLDASLARHAAIHSAKDYSDLTLEPVSWLCGMLNIPDTFRMAANWYKSQGKESKLCDLLDSMTRSQSLNKATLSVLLEIYGVEDVGHSFSMISRSTITFGAIVIFVEAVHEKYLFNDKLFENKDWYEKYMKVICDPQFSPEKLPILSGQLIKDTPKIYEHLDVEFDVKRFALRKLNIQQGMAKQAWDCETALYKRLLSSAGVANISDDPGLLLLELRSRRPPEYTKALQAINEIGLDVVGASIAGAGLQFVDSYLSKFSLSHGEKRALMKIFPQAKAQILEDDLGM